MEWKIFWGFVAGFVACSLLFFAFGYNLGVPFATGFIVYDGDLASPSDYLEEKDVVVFEDKLVLWVDDATISSYTDTGSMRPFFDENANGIRVVPENESEVQVGDIISFRFADMLVVHRVVEKGFDEEGVYFVVSGDSNLIGDGKIRFDRIEYKTIGILY
jgi:hypothetical protein